MLFLPSSFSTCNVPIAGCQITVSGASQPTLIATGAAQNVTGGAQATFQVTGINYTAVGCPSASGSTGPYRSNGPISMPGVTFS